MMEYPAILTDFYLDIIKEIGNIGAGNAATSLSKLLNRKISMEVPSVKLVSFDEMMDTVGGPEQEIASVFIRIEGDAPGNMFFFLTPEEANIFIKCMLRDDSFQLLKPPYDELALSAYLELGNIVSGSYLSALSDFTKLNLQPSVPSVSIDMVGAILTFGLIELSQVSDQVILIDTKVTDETNEYNQITGHFFLLLNPESFSTIFKALGVMNNE
jgi:chemotaxis protein CheC